MSDTNHDVPALLAEVERLRAKVDEVAIARNSAMRQRDEERHAKEGNIDRLNEALVRAEKAEAERDIYRRKAEVRAEELEMGSVDPLLFDGLRDVAESAWIALRNEKKIHDQTRAHLAAAREALARVEALADEWEQAVKKPMPERAATETAQDQGVRIGVWHSVRKATSELRAALAPTREEDR